MIESGFTELDGKAFPLDAIEPLPDKNGSTSHCFMVRINGKRHFMKRLRPEYVGHPRYESLIREEYELGSNLNHPNLVRYVSMGEDVDGIYLLTEFVEGEMLQDRIEQGKELTATCLHKFFSQLLQCLGYLHSHQIVHLDLKPDNLMITRVGEELKLIDLGFCYADSYDLTMGRNALYSAPEQQSGNLPDHRTDIYAVGRLLEECSRLSVCGKNKALQQVIRRSTSANPDHRYQSVQEMREALDLALTAGSLFSRIPKPMWWILLGALGLAFWGWHVSSPRGVDAGQGFDFRCTDGYNCRVLSTDSQTCAVTSLWMQLPDSNLMLFSPVRYGGRSYTITQVADSAFCAQSQLRTLSVSEGVTYMGIDACYDCTNLVHVSLPTTLRELNHGAFSSCHNLRTIVLPSALQTIGHGTFVGTYSLRHITIPEGITCLPTDCFVSSGIRTISLPSTLKVLERGVFYDCRSLRSITLPAGIERIGDFCFLRCDSLLEVTIEAPVPPMITNIFADTTGLHRTLFVPESSLEAYRSAPYWQDFAEIRKIE